MALTKTSKLIAIESYVKQDVKTFEEALEVLDNIWYIVVEGKVKPDEG